MKLNIAILAIIVSASVTSCGNKPAPATKPSSFTLSDSMQRMITTDTVTYEAIADELSLSGEVSFNENNMVKIFPRSSGQVTEARVSLGDLVKKGQVLAVVRSADVAGNYADLSGAKADLAIARRQMDNAESLYKSGIASEREYLEAKEGYDKAQASKEKVESVININGGGHTKAGGEYAVTAPIDGYVVEKNTAAGAFIRPDMGESLFTISNLQNVWIYANVYETDIAKVKPGLPVKVTAPAYPDAVFDGKIDQVSQVLDPQSKAMRVRVTLENTGMQLKPDMFAKVTVRSETGSKAISIPTSALLSQDGHNYVVRYKGPKDVKAVEVSVLKTIGSRTYLTDGVAPGDRLITAYQNLVFNQLMNE